MDKMKILKVDPLEISSTLVWYISGLLQAPLKDFVVYVDEKENILYVNKTKKIPKKDIDKIVEMAMCEDYFYTKEQAAFLDYVYKQYGSSAYKAISRSHDTKRINKMKRDAEELAKNIMPIIDRERDNIYPDEFLIYYVRQAADERGRRTAYNMVSYDSIYTFMLGYLAGTGKIPQEGVYDIDEIIEEEETESEVQ